MVLVEQNINSDLNLHKLLELAIHASFEAGKEILSVYETSFTVITKSDDTPVTEADKRANAIILKLLEETNIPCISEEGENSKYSIRKSYHHAWIIDPLDGTKEFVKRNGEFTVNIGLVENGMPLIGVIYSPVFKDLYFAAKGIGSFKTDKHVVLEMLNSEMNLNLHDLIKVSQQLPLQNKPNKYTVVASRSHLSSETYQFIENKKREYKEVDIVYTGSSIKMCWIAEGKANAYPRYGRTMEWDTCAGQCIVEQAGGKIVQLETNTPLIYNKENLENPNFLAYA